MSVMNYDQWKSAYPPAWDRESDIECKNCGMLIEDEMDTTELCCACAKEEREDKEEEEK